jgi:hypothetical protein
MNNIYTPPLKPVDNSKMAAIFRLYSVPPICGAKKEEMAR